MGFLSNLFGGGAAKAAKQAARIQSDAAKRIEDLAGTTTTAGLTDLDSALASALGAYDTGQAGATAALDPYAKAGTTALDTLMSALGMGPSGAGQTALDTLTNSPAYQFTYNQGLSALERLRNAGGRLYGGGTLKAAQEYGQGFATQQTGSLLDRLAGLVSGGQNAVTNQSNILSNFAGSRADAMLGTGANKASTRMTGLNAVSDAISGGAAAQAGGLVGAANAKAQGAQNILSLIGGVGKFFLGGGMKLPGMA